MRIRDFVTRHREGLTLAVLVLVSLVALTVSTESLSLRPKEVGQSAIALLQQGAAAVGGAVGRSVTSVRELANLRAEHTELLEQLRRYEATRDDVALLQGENERLREALGFALASAIRSIPARVIAKEPGTFFSGLTVNKGRTSGIERNMPVVANQGGVQGLVGRVVEAGLTPSVVMPIFDQESFVVARLRRTRHEGLVAGEGPLQGLLTMRYVTKSARDQIAVGDTVITSGMRSVFPEGIMIGAVESIQGRPFETSLQLLIEPLVDFSRLEYVFILTEVE